MSKGLQYSGHSYPHWPKKVTISSGSPQKTSSPRLMMAILLNTWYTRDGWDEGIKTQVPKLDKKSNLFSVCHSCKDDIKRLFMANTNRGNMFVSVFHPVKTGNPPWRALNGADGWLLWRFCSSWPAGPAAPRSDWLSCCPGRWWAHPAGSPLQWHHRWRTFPFFCKLETFYFLLSVTCGRLDGAAASPAKISEFSFFKLIVLIRTIKRLPLYFLREEWN